jgi:hypothetical protein
MACPVCFGGEDTVMRESLNAGIGVLMGVTAIVLAVLGRFIVVLARRSREAAHLIEEPVRLKADTTVGATH